ncbi:probable biotin/lipoate A/B protein ligase family [Psychrobacter arcticus 273-4]|uniref:Octanoyltransferase n=1 Tax=Psychrobacter arcticus (strain DSM 17307 / VKM B-2377 / 273-4) TaxID=259536 RepID=LIPB_PSYA2|nr:octanoyltransferase [Psychrobacter arcticus]Q4FS63.1 RecName: Full=Octanoyltransferase; AltName: Full=Lipoate-protein ligase B; AltName: Full=Lipoyl/octanoyl transferase; AltName: Full=Octanoyl-[acyl-carrier-protein]-protein N-octanoyltransferase [Psychrobacter arcticus 273-4]AAZ19145.1 probable biotin/lipoate A/B protein ligase family [Psychrobacter arcticus 273-4]
MPNTMQALNTQPLNDTLITKSITAADYVPTLDAMLSRTLARIALKKEQGLRTPDELWIVDHNDVYTLGQAGKEEHILQRTNTPIIKTDRGGQVTWHGHGQLVMYWLFDLDSVGWSVRNMVSHAEQAIEDVVNDCLKSPASTDTIHISARARRDAPGVYIYADTAAEIDSAHRSTDEIKVDNTIMIGKIASLGFKIKHGFSYHGVAINLNCDLSAFNAINPCGYAGMQMLRLADFVNMNQATTPQPNNPTLTDDAKTITYEQFTQKLIDNIAQRHAGVIPLRELAPK